MYSLHSGDRALAGDGVDRARLDAGVAVNAFGGVDVQLLGLGEAGLVRRRVDAVTGQTSTQDVSLVAIHGSLITYAIWAFRIVLCTSRM